MQYIEMENGMARQFHLLHQTQIFQGKFSRDMELSIWTSPAYRLSTDKKTGNMSCDTFTYRFYQEEESYYCQVIQKRAEAKFKESLIGTQMIQFNWYTIQKMKPWKYEKDPFSALGEYPMLPVKGFVDPEEYLKIRNVQNLFFEHRLHQVENLFSKEKNTELTIESLGLEQVKGKSSIQHRLQQCLAKEKENHHCYGFLGITCEPVIEIEADGLHAQGLFLTQIYQVDAYAKNSKQWKLNRQMGWTKSQFVKEEGQWKILTMEIRNIISFPEVSYRNDQRFDKMGQTEEPWNVDQELFGKTDIETSFIIENIVNRWIYSNRIGRMTEFAETYMKNPKNKNRMLIRSYGSKSVEQQNLEEIQQKLANMDQMYKNRFWSFHSPTTPVIQLSEDGMYAKATWFDLAATNLRSMMGKTGASGIVPYMIFVNKYFHQFEKMEGKWYLVDFFNEPIIAIPDWELDMEHNTGYINWKDSPKYPELFEL